MERKTYHFIAIYSDDIREHFVRKEIEITLSELADPSPFCIWERALIRALADTTDTYVLDRLEPAYHIYKEV